MTSWFYARGGTQHGPISLTELRTLAARGDFDPERDLVWHEGMSAWQPARELPEFAPTAAEAPPPPAPAAPPIPATAAPAAPDDPYATPASHWQAPATTDPESRTEIEPGSEPIDIGACLGRAFELTRRNFGPLFLATLVFFAITFALGMVLGAIEMAVAEGTGNTAPGQGTGDIPGFEPSSSSGLSPAYIVTAIFTNLTSQVVSTFLALGLTRIALEILDGRPTSVAMLFGEGSKLIPALLATLLFALAVGIGLLLFIAPGIYLALRFSQFQNAIVDRDMGVIESLQYSSRLTHNNKLPLLGIFILSVLIVIAGVLALLVGLLFVYPFVWMLGIVAYRWMQYGSRGALGRA